jgi:Raf kinase inhibitor-like YbhB/YbcL family protein
MKIKCPEFDNGGVIPERFTQYDENRSLPLNFEDVPADAQSLVLIMDDPDAPNGTFTHWIAFNIDPNTSGFRENHIPRDVRLGTNDKGRADYVGPRPPSGEHRYFIWVYALDCRLDLPHASTRSDIERAMVGHVVAEAELMGRFAAPINGA